MDLTIACVWVGDGYGAEYPAILQDMVRRNLSPAHTPRFVCITDRPGDLPDGIDAITPEPGMPYWWQKIAVFKPGKIPGERIAYFDLDVAITGTLDDLVERCGTINDWHLPGYNSSVMVWDAGEHADAWSRFTPNVMGRLRSDQDWLNELGGWDILPEPWCISYRSHAMVWPPADAKVVCFHGRPKPHEIKDSWVAKVWALGGLRVLPGNRGVNVPREALVSNMRSARERDLTMFTGMPPHGGECCLVGGGPGAAGFLGEIACRQTNGAAVASMNGSLRWLLENGITPSSHVVLDGRPENVEFVRDVPPETSVLIASQCHPALFDALASHPADKVILWHAALGGMDQQEQIAAVSSPEDDLVLLVGGGSTVGLRATYLAMLSGFKRLHLYGFDSCYADDGVHHAFPQALNDGERTIEVMMAGNSYRCAPWMAAQAQEFNGQHVELTRAGVSIEAHGPGLIPDICRILNEKVIA